MSDWRPQRGQDPSPNEARVLYCLIREWARLNHAYGPTLGDLFAAVVARYPRWAPSRSTVRAHLGNLATKEHVYAWDRRKHDGDKTWQPTDTGRFYIYELLHPDLSKIERSRYELQLRAVRE